jgi:hypothetical protein
MRSLLKVSGFRGGGGGGGASAGAGLSERESRATVAILLETKQILPFQVL